MLDLHATVLFKKSCSSRQVTGAVDCVTDTADFFLGADLHGALRHTHRSPELILIAVRIGEIDGSTLVTVGGCLYRVGVRDFVLIEPAQVRVDVLGPDVESASREILAELFGWRVVLRLQKRADAARSALPPH